MNVEIKVTQAFKRQAKPLLKKYASLAGDLAALNDRLAHNPKMGNWLMAGVRKVRLAIGSKAKGKSGGARVITYQSGEAAIVGMAQETGDSQCVILIAIYDKSETASISNAEIRRIIDNMTLAQ